MAILVGGIRVRVSPVANVTVNITVDGDAVTAYTANTGGTPPWTSSGASVSFPVIMSAETIYYVTEAGNYMVSVTYQGQEISTPTGVPALVAVDGSGSVGSVTATGPAPVPVGGGLGLFGSGQWGDFTMDPVAQTTAPQPTHTQALSQQTVTSYSQGGQTITYNYYSNCDVYWHNLTINQGCAYYSAGDRIFVAGALVLNGIIDFGATSINGTQGLSSTGNSFAGGAGGSTDPVYQAAGPAANGVGAGAAGVIPTQGTGMQASSRMGGSSGAGGAGAGGAGGTGRGAAANWTEAAGLPFDFFTARGYHIGPTGLTQFLGGCSGGNGAGDGGSNAGCYGGAGGGVVVVFAKTITGSGTIYSSGGNGGSIATTNVGGGGGGAGGLLIIVTQSAVWNGTAYTIPGITTGAPGGLHGTGGGGSGLNGVDGTAGNVVIMPA